MPPNGRNRGTSTSTSPMVSTPCKYELFVATRNGSTMTDGKVTRTMGASFFYSHRHPERPAYVIVVGVAKHVGHSGQRVDLPVAHKEAFLGT